MLRMKLADHVVGVDGIVRSDWSELMAIHRFEMWNFSFSALKIPLEFKWVLIFDWCLLRTDKCCWGIESTLFNCEWRRINQSSLVNGMVSLCVTAHLWLCICRSTGYDDCPGAHCPQYSGNVMNPKHVTHEHPNVQRPHFVGKICTQHIFVDWQVLLAESSQNWVHSRCTDILRCQICKACSVLVPKLPAASCRYGNGRHKTKIKIVFDTS